MIKLLIVILIVLIAFWMGRQSAVGSGKEVRKRNCDDESDVIDIEPED